MDSQQATQGLNDKLAESLLQVNKLLYKMPPNLGITNRRNHRTDYFQQAEYKNGETMVLDSQVGTDFVDPKNSYLKFKFTPNQSCDFASGSAANVINRVLVRTRTGKEICRVENANLLTKYCQLYDCPKDWVDTIGAAQGYGATTVTTAGKVFVVPLWVVPCFNVDKLLPPQMTTGLRIEIELESPAVATAEASVGVPCTSYTIGRPELHWDTHDLADQFKRKISEMASSQGLNVVHKEYFHSIVSGAAQTDYNFDIKKAASKALKLKIISRNNTSLTTAGTAAATDSMGSEGYNWARWQSHIGADYFPNQPLTVDDVSLGGNAEAYYATQFACGKASQCWYPTSITPTDYTSTESMIAFNFNKSSVSELQGYQINNSRAVIVDLTAASAEVKGSVSDVRRLDVYLCFLRAAKYFTSNAEVRD